MAKVPPGVGPRFPQVVVLFGATGDLAKRKLLPGLYHLCAAGFLPEYRIIGVSLDDIDTAAFSARTREALAQHFNRPIADEDWAAFAERLAYVPLSAGAAALAAAAARAEASIGQDSQRLHYLSVPPSAALSAVRTLGEAGLVANARMATSLDWTRRSCGANADGFPWTRCPWKPAVAWPACLNATANCSSFWTGWASAREPLCACCARTTMRR